jgi:hypothetical protein
MQEQNFENHSRIHKIYHIVTGLALLALIIGAVRNLIRSEESNVYSAALLVLSSLVMLSIYLFARSFALKAQDRAIRAEENFRYFMLTGKTIDKRINLQQIIALRFASDEEFPSLAQQAADKGLSNKDIKKAIRQWRADHHRV